MLFSECDKEGRLLEMNKTNDDHTIVEAITGSDMFPTIKHGEGVSLGLFEEELNGEPTVSIAIGGPKTGTLAWSTVSLKTLKDIISKIDRLLLPEITQ